jgi:hypothetical protein
MGEEYFATATNADELIKLLKEFPARASRNDAMTPDRFWAEALIYTGSSLRRIDKASIMLRDLHSAPAPMPEDLKTTYGAEDIRIAPDLSRDFSQSVL